MPKTISMRLNSRDVNAAIRELEAYAKRLEKLPVKLNEALLDEAEESFDYYLSDATPNRAAAIETEKEEGTFDGETATSRFTARGKTEKTGFNILMAVEFGAGAYHNPSGSNSGYATKMGMGPGTWPPSDPARPQWQNDYWLYPDGYDEDGNIVWGRTYGTPSSAPMYHMTEDLRARLRDIAAEVAKKWM